MFLFCKVDLICTKMPNTFQIFWEMFKLLKNVTYYVFVFGACNRSIKKMIKIDVLYLVSQFFRTRTNNFYILK